MVVQNILAARYGFHTQAFLTVVSSHPCPPQTPHVVALHWFHLWVVHVSLVGVVVPQVARRTGRSLVVVLLDELRPIVLYPPGVRVWGPGANDGLGWG